MGYGVGNIFRFKENQIGVVVSVRGSDQQSILAVPAEHYIESDPKLGKNDNEFIPISNGRRFKISRMIRSQLGLKIVGEDDETGILVTFYLRTDRTQGQKYVAIEVL